METTTVTVKAPNKPTRRGKINKNIDKRRKIKRFKGYVNGIRSQQNNGVPRDAVSFRKFAEPSNLLPALQQYHKYVRSQYLMALIHPDIAVKQQIPVKLPSDVPIPTASVGYHVQHQFTTSAAGTFLLSWRPCAMWTAPEMAFLGLTDMGQLTLNRDAGLTGTGSSPHNSFVATGYYPNVELQRYRLVSALIKVSYNGTVLNQSGTMLSCATFDPLVVAVGDNGNPVTGYADPLVDRFGQFSLIQNGLWNTSVNITGESEGLECLYVPTDPDDYTFQKTGTFYGTQFTVPNLYAPDKEGAHINYIVAGRNLTASTSNIIVDIYYNYEVIADPSAAPFLRSAPDSAYRSTDKQALSSIFTQTMKDGGLIKPVKKENGYGDIFQKIMSMGFKYIPMILKSIA